MKILHLLTLITAFALVWKLCDATAVQSRWQEFVNQHIVSDAGADKWNIVQWNTWLKSHLGSKYNTKFVNSVISGNTDAVLKSYSGYTVTPNDNKRDSKNSFTVYVFKKYTNKKTGAINWNGLKCENKYVTSVLWVEKSANYPVHFQDMRNKEQGCKALS